MLHAARFAWEDAAPAAGMTRNTGGYGGGGGGGYGGGGGGFGNNNSSDVCYKCNQTGHWAKDCPNAGGGGGGGGGGVCYKCNQVSNPRLLGPCRWTGGGCVHHMPSKICF